MGPDPLLAGIVLLGGNALLTLAVAGLLRISDAWAKVHAVALGATVTALLVVAAALASGRLDFVVRALLVAAFLLVTSPLASHAITRLEALRREVEAREGERQAPPEAE